MEEVFILKEDPEKISEAKDIFKNIKEIKVNYDQENFLVFCLDTKNKIIKAEVLFKGGLNECVFDPKIIFRFALINNSSKIIIAHNHPSNSLIPSEADKQAFYLLKEYGSKIDLNVLDSIIFNKKEYYSLNELE